MKLNKIIVKLAKKKQLIGYYTVFGEGGEFPPFGESEIPHFLVGGV